MAVPSKKAAWVVDKFWVWEGPVVPHGLHGGPGRGRGGPQPHGGQMVLSCLLGDGFLKLFLNCFSQTRKNSGWGDVSYKKKSQCFVSKYACILF